MAGFILRKAVELALPYVEEAVELEERRNAKKSVNPEILYHLAVIRNKLGDTSGARTALDEAKRNGGDKSLVAEAIRDLKSQL